MFFTCLAHNSNLLIAFRSSYWYLIQLYLSMQNLNLLLRFISCFCHWFCEMRRTFQCEVSHLLLANVVKRILRCPHIEAVKLCHNNEYHDNSVSFRTAPTPDCKFHTRAHLDISGVHMRILGLLSCHAVSNEILCDNWVWWMGGVR